MDDNLDKEVKAIIKFVNGLYSPDKVTFKEDEFGNRDIYFYFKEIDNKYRFGRSALAKNYMRQMFTREIRKSIYDFLAIKTHGFQPEGSENDLPYWNKFEEHPIHIWVEYLK